MRQRLFLVSFLVLALLEASHAQNNTKWAVGPDLLGLFNKNVLPKYSLFARYKLGENGAVRLRGGISFYEIDRQYLLYDYNEQKTYTFRAGYERSKTLHKKSFFLHYGAEFVHFYDYVYRYEYSGPFPTMAATVVRYSQNGGAAFIGCRYFFIPVLSLSFESAFQVTKSSVSRSTAGIRSETLEYTTTNLLPINTLNICFHF